MRSVKRSVALAIVAIAAGGAVSLSAAGVAQAAPHGGQSVSISHKGGGWDNDDRGHGKGNDWGNGHGNGWGNGHGNGHGNGWNKKNVKWSYAGSYHSKRICEKVARAGELTDRWDDSKCVGNGWGGGAKLFVKKYRWGW